MKKPILFTSLLHPRSSTVLFSILLVILCVVFSWGIIHEKRQQFRENLQFQAQLITDAINPDRVYLLSGTQQDSASTVYQRLKRQFIITRNNIPNAMRLYLMGKNESGYIFYYADSEPNTRPGTFYENISEGALSTFTSPKSQIIGPYSGKNGSQLSVLTPLIDPDTDEFVAVLGMDISIQHWNSNILLTVSPIVLLMVILVCLLFIVRFRADRNRRFMGITLDRRHELMMAIIFLGLFISTTLAYTVHYRDTYSRVLAFNQIAGDKSAIVSTSMETLLNVDLEALARYFEASDYVSVSEFSEYSDFLVQNPRIHSWEWVSPVLAGEQNSLDQQFHNEGYDNFFIWQNDESGNKIPAAGRDTLFPITRIAPLKENEHLLGFDIGSSQLTRSALQMAARTGRPVCSLLHLPQGEVKQPLKEIMVFRPVLDVTDHHDLQGFAVAILKLNDVLESAHPNSTITLTMGLWETPDSLAVLATSYPFEYSQGKCFTLIRPVYLFGETFFIIAHAGPDFISLYPERSDKIVFVAGLVLTLLLVLLINSELHRRERLELLVSLRTEELAEAKERIELALHGGDLGTWDWDVDKKEILFNSRCAVMLGFPSQDLLLTETEWQNLLPVEEKKTISDELVKCVIETDGFYELEHRLLHRNGEWVWVLARGKAITRNLTSKTHRVCGTYLDISNRKKAESEREKLQTQLSLAQKMEAVGRLAGGVAHDLNNMLSPIIGYSELLLEDLPANDEKRVIMNEIINAGFRARDLVRQLLAFSRKQTLEFKPVNLNTIIENFEKLLRRTITEDIDIHTVLSSDIRTVMADVGQIEQVIMNLAVNAADAMKDGGRLTIETGMVYLDEEYAATHSDVQSGRYVMLAVSDNGCGMDDQIRERIFDPFFSTKGDLGTGLGLATVYGIVKQHGGNIWVYSELNNGTTFKIYLPITTILAGEAKKPELETKILTGNETVLLVEDNEQVRELAQTILRRLGYKLIVATNGEEALSKSKASLEPVHLLLTDVIMPGINGRELYEEVKKRYPFIKVIYMSGYTDNVIAHHGVLEPGIAYVQKPFSMHIVAKKIREVLDA